MEPIKESQKPRQRLKVRLVGKNNELVTWEELEKLEQQDGKETVLKFLKGGSLVFPVEEASPPNPEFVKHMDNLRKRQEMREYARMMGDAMPKGSHLSNSMTSISPEHTGVGASGFQLSVMGLNMVIGIGCAFVGADYLGRQYGLDPITRVGVSLTAMVFVMMLEMLLFIIRSSRFDEIDKQRNARRQNTFAPSTGLGLDLHSTIQLSDKKND